jgi:predicted transcriptional regulator YdeE
MVLEPLSIHQTRPSLISPHFPPPKDVPPPCQHIAQTDRTGKNPDGLIKLEIPASTWAVFEVHGPMPHAMKKAWKQIFSEWFPSSGYKLAGTPELEVYDDDDPYKPDYYSEIWIPVK